MLKCSSCALDPQSHQTAILKRFQSSWSRVDRDKYEMMDCDDIDSSFLEQAREFLRGFTSHELLVRDDYHEVLELTMLVLGIGPEKPHWSAPGPVRHARLMAKLIYGLKMYLFRQQRQVFGLTGREQNQLQRFVQFGALIYAQAWLQAPLATEAPAQDVALWKALEKYKVVDSSLATAAQKVQEHHLWYLSDELVGLALFSNKVTDEEKVSMVMGLTRVPGARHV